MMNGMTVACSSMPEHQAATGDIAVRRGLREQACQHATADAIHCTAETGAIHRFIAQSRFARKHFSCANRFQKSGVFGFSGNGMHFKAGLGEQACGQHADAAGCAVDGNRTESGVWRFSSMRSRASPAVKPAVPRIITSRRDKPAGKAMTC